MRHAVHWPSRRIVLASVVAVGLPVVWRPARAMSDVLTGVLKVYTGGTPTSEGKVRFDIAPLVENGNTVPINVTVESPMSADNHVQALAIFNEKNPQRDVITCKLTPRMGKASVSTRIRLATSQQLVAVARMSDGSCWTHTVDVVVTLAACIE
jgi:sulfur-oxidizing protein SoxY